MKILLINPPLVFNKRVGSPAVFQPLGLAYVAAVLEKEHEITIIDANVEGRGDAGKGGPAMGLSMDGIRERVRMLRPDIVGITVPFSVNAASALDTARAVKSVDKNIITILGGPHPSIRPVETLANDCVDIIVIGEGEATVKELVHAIGSSRFASLKEVKGIGFKTGDTPVLTEKRPLIRDLDSIPFPARHLLPMDKYFSAFESGAASRPAYTYGNRWASVFTSRGCPFNCNFCSIRLTMGRGFRARSSGNVILEIDELVKRHGIRHINIEDDNFTFDRDRVLDVCNHIMRRSYGITWSTPNGIRADRIDEEVVSAMAASGCRRVFIAPESGVQRVVTEIIRKKLDLGKVEDAVRLFSKHGIAVDASFVIGSIGETKNDIWKTIRFAMRLKRLGMDKAGFHIATPLYGTKLYEDALAKGYLTKEPRDDEFSTGQPLIETPEWTGADLRRFQGIANWLVNYSAKEKVSAVYKRLNHIPGYIKVMSSGVLKTDRRRVS